MKLVDVYQGGKVSAGAIDFLYSLLAERPAESNISHREMPTIEQHRQFVHRRPYRAWLLIENEEGERVGSLYLTDRNEVGIFIKQEHQRKGYAEGAILEMLEQFEPLPAVPSVRPGKFQAHVSPRNEPSRALFGKKLGGKLIQETYEL